MLRMNRRTAGILGVEIAFYCPRTAHYIPLAIAIIVVHIDTNTRVDSLIMVVTRISNVAT